MAVRVRGATRESFTLGEECPTHTGALGGRCGLWNWRWFGSSSNQVFAVAGQKTRQQSCNALQQNPILRTERILAIALYVQKAKFTSGDFHRYDDLFSGAGSGQLRGVQVGCILQKRGGGLRIQSQIDSSPAIVPSLTKQASDCFERRVVKRRAICGKQAFNLGKQRSSGTIRFHDFTSLIGGIGVVNKSSRDTSPTETQPKVTWLLRGTRTSIF